MSEHTVLAQTLYKMKKESYILEVIRLWPLEGNWGVLDMVCCYYCRAVLAYPRLPWQHQSQRTRLHSAAKWLAVTRLLRRLINPGRSISEFEIPSREFRMKTRNWNINPAFIYLKTKDIQFHERAKWSQNIWGMLVKQTAFRTCTTVIIVYEG